MQIKFQIESNKLFLFPLLNILPIPHYPFQNIQRGRIKLPTTFREDIVSSIPQLSVLYPVLCMGFEMIIKENYCVNLVMDQVGVKGRSNRRINNIVLIRRIGQIKISLVHGILILNFRSCWKKLQIRLLGFLPLSIHGLLKLNDIEFILGPQQTPK